MSKELEALKFIKNVEVEIGNDLNTATKVFELNHEYNKAFDIVEKALKEYEMMKQIKIIVVDKKISDDDLDKLKNQRVFVGNLEQCEIKSLFDERTQKQLKALEIIKEKNVNVRAFRKVLLMKQNDDVKLMAYNSQNDKYEDDLTQEEYDLLKEVLL